jgi:hypothetical protein
MGGCSLPNANNPLADTSIFRSLRFPFGINAFISLCFGNARAMLTWNASVCELL